MVLGVYFVCPRRFRNGVLLAASLVFYAWGEPEFVWFMLLSIAQGYGFGLLAERWKNDPKRKNLPLAASLCISLGLLGWCKYAGFFAQNLRQLTGWDIPVIRVALPIGISFYTFQIISYVVDVWRGTVPAQKNLINLAAYIAMFPQLIAGPIVRYADVREQLNTRRTTGQNLAAGLSRFVAGLSKKVLLANTLYALVTQFKAAEQRTVLFCWLYALAYVLHLYFDFSGYSDMAIGLGHMFGFSFPENFDYPYLSRSISEYWRRWHITLGTWFREYVYIPLGGNRKGSARTLLNLFVVFFLTGLWHGADWQFVVFGILMGLTVVLERLFLRKILDKLPRLFGHVYTIAALYVMLTIFGANSLGSGLKTLRGIFTQQTGAPQYVFSQFVDGRLWCVLFLALLLCGPLQAILPPLRRALYRKEDISLPGMVLLIGILLFSIMRVTASSYNPFIYFRF